MIPLLPPSPDLTDFTPNPNPNPNPNSPTPQFFQEIFDAASIDENPGSIIDGEEEELEWISNKDAFPPLESSFDPTFAVPFFRPSRARSSRRRRRRKIFLKFLPEMEKKKKCTHCEVEKTPQWRFGPDGPKTLCNACGVRFNSGRLVPEYRPANSPTFSAGIHSNSHRRVMEIRGRKYGAGRRGRSGF